MPLLWATYWSFRVMVGGGGLLLLISAFGLWSAHRERFAHSRWFTAIAMIGMLLPLLGNASGWIFTEMGRQPLVVFGVMKTLRGVSGTVPVAEVHTTLVGFTVIYTLLGVADVALMTRAAHKDLAPERPGGEQGALAGLVY